VKLLVFLLGTSLLAAAPSGEAVFHDHCATCHDSGDPKIPARATLQKLPSARILRVLDSGIMSAVAAPLKEDERASVAAFLGTTAPDLTLRPQAYCKDRTVKIGPQQSWNGWSPDLANTRYQPASAANLSIDQVRHLKLKWAFGFDGDLTSFSQPAVLAGQVFAGSSAGMVYALQAGSGCIEWLFQAGAPVRTAMAVAPINGNRHALLFGDQTAWFYAVEAETGKLLWRKRVDDHPGSRITGSPMVSDGIAYVPVSSWEETLATQPGYQCCTSRGSITALRVRDGSQVWKSYTVPAEPKPTGKRSDGTLTFGPSGAGTWSAPTIDRKRGVLYVTTGNNYSPPATDTSDAVIAMNLATGKIEWTRQLTPRDIFTGCTDCFTDDRGPDVDFGASAILIGEVLVAGQKSGMVTALNPDRKGEMVWQRRIAEGSSHGGVQWGMASDGQLIYAPIADGKLLTATGPDGKTVRSMDPHSGGGLAALRAKDGSLAWQAAPTRACENVPSCSPSQLAAATVIPGIVFSGALDGHLRAYSTENGKIVWDFNTARDFTTVNGVKANGGALNGNGPVVVNGMVFVNSGYDHFGSITGNVLLAFAP
jgi:polyvinyl alcohol dehydrogenase (cytochrome)